MAQTDLQKLANELVEKPKGILATDATESTMDKRMKAEGIEPNPELRRVFREILITTPEIENYISGIILNDEIIRQNLGDGRSFVQAISERGIKVGIKVDKKAHDLANFPGEKITEGLDGLRDRLREYKEMGAVFTKWRAVISISENTPTRPGVESNTHALTRYAALVQESGMVPIMEPEILMEGEHDIADCARITEKVVKSMYAAMFEYKVDPAGTVLKVNMILPGRDNSEEKDLDDATIAKKTLDSMREAVSVAVPGVVFLSGGQDAKAATNRLNEINKIIQNNEPWNLSFSFERALEGPSLEVWHGDNNNWEAAQQAFLHRAKMNSAATKGEYSTEMEK